MSLAATCLLARRCPALRLRELGSGFGMERGNLTPDTVRPFYWVKSPGRRERDLQAAETARSRVAIRGTGADRLVLAMKAL